MIVGLFLKHIKAYKGINYIPIGHDYNFVSYVGENGVGKSSILEALDSFFNNKPYPINKSAKIDGTKTSGNEPYVAPVFCIPINKVTRLKKDFKILSDYFWAVQKKDLNSAVQGSMKGFFDIRDNLINSISFSPDTHYLLVAGETNLELIDHELSVISFSGEDSFIEHMGRRIKGDSYFESFESRKNAINTLKVDSELSLNNSRWKKFLEELKSLYSLIYFPVELEVESFTKIETTEMQKVFDTEIRSEIEKSLASVEFNKAKGINKILGSFVAEIEDILKKEYCYHTGASRNSSVSKSDLVDKILEVYFQKRVLHKEGESLTKVSELSAGEKRQALINLIYAFLKRKAERDKMVIIAIDEPENSLHMSLCYDQFEKLKEISSSNQVLITTHWYGFLPAMSQGYSHFINDNSAKIGFDSYDLYNYRSEIKVDIQRSQNKLPVNPNLKSTYDLVQSIFYSLKGEPAYNWLICEGISEKIYFEHFFKDEIENSKLRILAMGGAPNVVRLFRYLQTPLSEENTNGKVFCLIDTDQERQKEIGIEQKNLAIKRLSNQGNNKKTSLLKLDHPDTHPTDIEQALTPVIFNNTINQLSDNEQYKKCVPLEESGNTDFIKNFKNLDIADYFKENYGENKVLFAKRYVINSKETALLDGTDHKKVLYPDWIAEIKKYFTR